MPESLAEQSAKKQASAMLKLMDEMDRDVFWIRDITRTCVQKCRRLHRLRLATEKTKQKFEVLKAFEKWHRDLYCPRIRSEEKEQEPDNAFWRDAMLESVFHREMLMQLE